MEIPQIIIYIFVMFLFAFVVVPYLMAYMSYLLSCTISGQNIVSSIKGSLKAPFNKNGSLSIFIISEIALVLCFMLSLLKFYK